MFAPIEVPKLKTSGKRPGPKPKEEEKKKGKDFILNYFDIYDILYCK